MSLVLMVLYWVAIPLFGFLGMRWLWRRARVVLLRGLVGAVAVAGFLGWFWLVAGERLWLDHKVRELCAVDGGVRVYETVTLPPEKLDELKRVNFMLPDKTRAEPVDEYYSETDRHYYRKGNPEVSRRQYRIIRRSDQKILGELVFYGRGGGDLPGPWHGSSFTCPDPTQVHFESTIFVKGDKQ